MGRLQHLLQLRHRDASRLPGMILIGRFVVVARNRPSHQIRFAHYYFQVVIVIHLVRERSIKCQSIKNAFFVNTFTDHLCKIGACVQPPAAAV